MEKPVPFGEVVKSYEDALAFFSCTKEVAKEEGGTLSYTFSCVDTYLHPGIKFAYLKWLKDSTVKVVKRLEDVRLENVLLEKEGNEEGEKYAVVEWNSKDEETINIKKYKKLRNKAERLVREMNVIVTGARQGELIKGVRNTSSGALISLVKGDLPAAGRELSLVRLFPDLWSLFLSKMRNTPHFSNLSIDICTGWFNSHEVDSAYFLSDSSQVRARVLDVGRSTFLKAGEKGLDEIISLFKTSLKDLEQYIPRKPGSKADHHTLIFLPQYWKLENTFHRKANFSSKTLFFDLPNKKFVKRAKNVIVLSLEEEVSIAFGVEKPGPKPDYWELLKERYPDEQEGVLIDFLVKELSSFTAAGYKSLLQKLIRYAPLKVKVGEEEVDAQFLLHFTFTSLLVHPGAFVPDIQRFVTGQESALKRLAVSILEDSWLSDYHFLHKLLAMSLISQRALGWSVSPSEYGQCLDACTFSLTTRNYFAWSIEKEIDPFTYSSDSSPLTNTSALLDVVRSFASDLTMTRSIAQQEGEEGSVISSKLPRPDLMDVTRCVDFHWCPEIAYYLPIGVLEQFKEKSGSKPFHTLFRTMFRVVSGKNSRKSGSKKLKMDEKTKKEFRREVKRAQGLVYLSRKKRGKKVEKEEEKEKEEEEDEDVKERIESKLDVSWISGMLGPIDISGNPPAMVILRPSDPTSLVAVRKPSRGMKEGTLEDRREQQVLKAARAKLLGGIPMKGCPAPHPSLAKATLYFDGEEFTFTSTGYPERVPWKEFRKVIVTPLVLLDVGLGSVLSPQISSVLLRYGKKGVREGAVGILKKLSSLFDVKVLRRVKGYLSSNRNVIEVTRLSKDGGGTAQVAVFEDAGAYQFLLKISFLFPSALERIPGGSSFKVVSFPVLWKVKEKLFGTKSLTKSPLKTSPLTASPLKERWEHVRDSSKRTPKSYQLALLSEMRKREVAQKKGHFIHASVGLGKTLVLLLFLQYLMRKNSLPKYVVYATPKSAIDSLLVELDYFGFPTNLLIPTKGWKKNARAKKSINHDTLLPNHINVIEHDHMRFLEEALLERASDTFFIVDEVHKTLSDTKRTGVALDIARLSQDFVVMTGTPTNDSNTFRLFNWLELLAEFPVTENNFWVASAGMNSQILSTGVNVIREMVPVEMTEKERTQYLNHVPASLGGRAPIVHAKSLNEAFDICYRACNRELVASTLSFLDEGRRVMLVAKDFKHQAKLREMLVESNIEEEDIHSLKGDESLFLTDEAVENGKVKDYLVAITTIRLAEGYTLTRMSAMVTSVYPSAQSTREQLLGRINRITQQSKDIYVKVVHCGILSYVLEKHEDAASISALMKSLSKGK